MTSPFFKRGRSRPTEPLSRPFQDQQNLIALRVRLGLGPRGLAASNVIVAV